MVVDVKTERKQGEFFGLDVADFERLERFFGLFRGGFAQEEAGIGVDVFAQFGIGFGACASECRDGLLGVVLLDEAGGFLSQKGNARVFVEGV